MADEAEVVAEEVETPAEAPVSDPGSFEPEIKKDPVVDENPTDTPEVADAGEQDAEAADEPAKIDPRLLEKAAQYGWNESDLQGIDPDKLERMILRAEVARLTPPPEKKAEPQKTPPFELKFPDEFDPAAKEVIEKINGHYSAQVEKLNSELTQVLAYVNHQQMQQLDDRISGLFTELGEDYGDVFGKGKMAEVARTPAGEKRSEVLRHMDILERGYAARGEKLPNEKELFKAAVSMVSPVDVKKAASRELNSKLTAAKKNLFVRPKNRSKNETPLGYEKAVGSVAAILEKHRAGETPDKFE
jgi:hypothetical protein